MAEHNPTREDSSSHPLGPLGRSCEEWECLIADALDGTVPAADSAAFEQHRRECAACAGLLEQAGRGIAWLSYLESEPAPPAELLAKILARTSGPAATAPATSAKVEPVSPPPLRGWYRTALPAARRMIEPIIEPRMWMTAAMAFFSIALTLNLIGIRLSDIRLADLRPSVALANVSRQYYSTKERGAKYYDNLRFVSEMESQVRELTGSQEPAAAPLPDDTQSEPSPSPSSRNGGPGRGARQPQGEGHTLATDGQPRVPGPRIHQQGTRTQAERSLA